MIGISFCPTCKSASKKFSEIWSKMASNTLKNPLLRHFAKRGYAQACTVPSVKETRIQSCLLPTNTFVAALDNGSPVTRVTIAFKAGSRYEPATERGISHVLRSSAGLSTGKASVFIIRRKLAQFGATFSASGDREFIYYTVESTQDNLQSALECLNSIISKQEFRPWELSDNAARLKYDIAALQPQVRAVDLLHKAAFRRGLGNSLFISPNNIGNISSESLQHFATSTVTPNRCAVGVVGDTQERAQLIAQCLELPKASNLAEEASKYYGGEMRKEMNGDLAHVALAVQGAPAGSPQSLALAIAAKALGSGPVTKWGSDNSVLAKAIGNIGPFAAAGFNVSYSDNGLFGVVLSVPKDEANAAVKAVAGVLKNPSALTSSAITAGKNLLKLQILSEADDGTSLAETLAVQGLYTGKAKTPLEMAKSIDQITDSQVTQFLSSAVKTKLSMGAVGNLAFVPFADEL